MTTKLRDAPVEEAKQAALEVLRHNFRGPCGGLPRAAGWAYPEPYTRDIMIASLGVMVSGDERLVKTLRRVLAALARNQTPLGHVPSLAHDPENLGASDTTPLFLIGLALFRKSAGEPKFLEAAAEKALRWLEYQNPENRILIAQQPTTDWRDEQWVLGYGLYVNALAYIALRLFGRHERARVLRDVMNRLDIPGARGRTAHKGFTMPRKPYYAFWTFKEYRSERFDLLGNSLAVLGGIASPARAKTLMRWIETQCGALRDAGDLADGLTPNFFPYIRPDDPDWMPRYATYNMPGEYHNGGVWPFICGFHVAALVTAGAMRLAEEKLALLTRLVRPANKRPLEWGFNEWLRARDGAPRGEDWQTWSAAMYLYAAACVERRSTPLLDEIRRGVAIRR